MQHRSAFSGPRAAGLIRAGLHGAEVEGRSHCRGLDKHRAFSYNSLRFRRGSDTMTATSIAQLERICSKNPASILFARLADGMLRSGNTERATEICREGLRYRPFYPTGHLVMGRCHMAAGRFDEARREFHDTLALDQDNPAACWLLGLVERRLGFEERALQYFRRALAVDPMSRLLIAEMDAGGRPDDEPASGSGMGSASEASEDSGKSDRVSGQREDFPHLSQDLPGQRGSAGDRAAISEAGNGIAPIATPTLAELYVAQGLIEEAVAVLKQVREREPDDKTIKKRLKELQKLEGTRAGG